MPATPEQYAAILELCGSSEKAVERVESDPVWGPVLLQVRGLDGFGDPYYELPSGWDATDVLVAALLGGARVVERDEDEPEDDGKSEEHARRLREPDLLELTRVSACEARLRERSAVIASGRRVPHELTYEQIGRDSDIGFERERVRLAWQLLLLGWPLQKHHRSFSAEDDYVRLPSVEKAASELGLSDTEVAARLAEKTLPLT